MNTTPRLQFTLSIGLCAVLSAVSLVGCFQAKHTPVRFVGAAPALLAAPAPGAGARERADGVDPATLIDATAEHALAGASAAAEANPCGC